MQREASLTLLVSWSDSRIVSYVDALKPSDLAVITVAISGPGYSFSDYLTT